MAWDLVATLLLLSVLIQLILLVLSLIYNGKIIRPNKEKLFWKIRRPSYFIFYIIITLLNDTLRCLDSLLLHLNVINVYWWNILSVPLAYFGGITWGSIRLWLLYYDIKTAKKNQLFLLSKHLTETSESFNIKMGNIKPYKLKTYQFVTVKVFVIVTTFCIITFFIDIILGLTSISKLLMYMFIVFLLIFYTYFIFKLSVCCKCKCPNNSNKTSLQTSLFRDDWNLLLELTIIWVIWIVGIVCAILSFPFRGHSLQPVFIAYLTTITRSIITLTMMFVPYKVSLRLNKYNTKTITLSTLQNILSTKAYFFSFVEHLVQELAIENLTFLVEVWQFKFEEKYSLKPSEMSKKINATIENSKSKTTSKEQTNTEWLNNCTPTVEGDDCFPSHLLKIQQIGATNSTADINKLIEFLKVLPWSHLPLAQSIAHNLLSKGNDGNNKWKQCQQIYHKYLDENSYDSINISYATRNEIYAKYYDLQYYIQCKNNDNISNDNEIPPAIKNDDEFNRKLTNIFNGTLCDIVPNLRDSLSRFVETEEFRLAH